jgi:hypothetical protein
LLPLKTFEEKFAGALTGIKLSKIRYEDAKEVLRLVMLKIGLRAANIPVEEDKAILISHIAVNYGNHTLDEIILAFDLAIAGKLGIEVNCYENFSCLYFSGIMNAYRVWAVKTNDFIARKRIPYFGLPFSPNVRPPLNLPAPESKPMLDDEFIQMFFDLWRALKNYKAINVKCFSILINQGKIKTSEGEEREKIIRRATHDLHEELFESGEILSFEKKENRINILCKKIVVENYFKTL